jgi:hypothetical protein
MELGSLYDVLHNELVPRLPDTLKNKLALQVLFIYIYLFINIVGLLIHNNKIGITRNALFTYKWNSSQRFEES